MNKLIYFSSLIIILCLNCCSNHRQIEAPIIQINEQQLFDKANDLLQEANYSKAADNFAKLYTDYPYSKLATRSKLLEAFAYHKNQDFFTSVMLLDDFIKLHPAYLNIQYAYYLRTLSYYYQIEDIDHDQTSTKRAKVAILDFLNRFDDSEYIAELKLKLHLIDDHLAGKEMSIGRYYLHNQELLASLGRFRHVVDNYQTTTHIQEALARLVEIYLSLNLKQEAQSTAAVLGFNYPTNWWYYYSYQLINKNKLN